MPTETAIRNWLFNGLFHQHPAELISMEKSEDGRFLVLKTASIEGEQVFIVEVRQGTRN